ncbi:hypothetical protein C2869_16285 [Saccharobesus litoralis]|uniref:Uncharacterized protein n=1 Tax=Saccharobesus litoralis TaxID=2172099 RepID=A0A2S0VUI7_9ALTE|nr:hypothetical protein [Saccharobesus litoralis]AWB67886.1 hypothetical protein C2869_16285 [Saccharobesus litoralis]
MNTNQHTKPNPKLNTQDGLIAHAVKQFSSIDMCIRVGVNNNQTGKYRRETTVKVVERVGHITPTVISWLYDISRHQALEHLNKLVKDELLTMVKTHRSNDGRVYVLTYAGAQYAQSLMTKQVNFRSKRNPALQFNANNVMHDSICTYVLMLANKYDEGWQGIVTEKEFKQLVKSNETRHVDGLVLESNGTVAAIEIEHSFKTKQSRSSILLKWLHGLNQGYYQKIFLFSQSTQIFDDIKRLHEQLFDEMQRRIDKKTKQPSLSKDDAELLRRAIIFRTKYCHEINRLFYN